MGNNYGSLDLNGSTQYGVVADNDDHDLGQGDFSIDVAFTIDGGSGTRVLLDKWASNVGWRVNIVNTGVMQFLFNSSIYRVSASASAAISDGEWHYFHVSINRSRGRAYIFIDGTLDGTLDISGTATVSNSQDLNIGWNGTDEYWNGKVSEIRLSSRVRHEESFTQDVMQFVDDAWTEGLYHFNEGAGTTSYDMSSKRNHVTVTGSPSYVAGPYRLCPPVIVYEQIWLAIDAYDTLTTFLTARNGRKYRHRPGDATPGNWTATNTPELMLVPTKLPDLEEETSAFHNIKIPIQIQGTMHFKSVNEILTFWWLTVEALWSSYQTNSTAGRMNYTRIQHMQSQGPSFDVQEAEDKSLFSAFKDIIIFDVRHDLLGTP